MRSHGGACEARVGAPFAATVTSVHCTMAASHARCRRHASDIRSHGGMHDMHCPSASTCEEEGLECKRCHNVRCWDSGALGEGRSDKRDAVGGQQWKTGMVQRARQGVDA